MAFDPMTALITGGLTLADMFGKSEQRKVAQGQLAETQRMNDAMLRAAKAGRTDAFGNRLSFDDALNEWITQLSPSQQALLKAGEREQGLQLTEDAARNRIIQAMQARTGQQANELLSGQLSRFGVRGQEEGSNRAQLQRLINAATPQVGARSLQQPGGAVITQGPSGTPQQRLAQIMLQARQGALGETGTRQTQQRSGDLGAISQLYGISQGGKSAAPGLPNVGERANAQSDAAMQRLIQAMQAGNQIQQGAYGNLAKYADIIPSGKDIASIYSTLTRANASPAGRATPTSSSSLGPVPSFSNMNAPGRPLSPQTYSWMDTTQPQWSSEYAWF